MAPAQVLPALLNGASARRFFRPSPLSTERFIFLLSLFFAASSNFRFFAAVAAGRDLHAVSSWKLIAGSFILVVAIHCLLLGGMFMRRSAKPLAVVLLLATAAAGHFMNSYAVIFDTGMLRNVMQTDLREAGELMSGQLLLALAAYGVLPALVVARVPLARRGWRHAASARLLFMLAALGCAAGSVALNYQDLSALLRNQKEVRYLITPANYLVSLGRVLAGDQRKASGPRLPVAADAALGPSWAQRNKPVLLVLVVGETARAANWGLNGYARQTTPELASAGVINFSRASSCGTDTETSVPCMFSPYGRHDYDEQKIWSHESLLHVLARAGFRVIWRDNQSGCKGVCSGLESQRTGACGRDGCPDEALLDNLEAEVRRTRRPTVLVLHQLGNHGPAYSHRYPKQFARFLPACEQADLGKCTRQEIVNSYDNALLYTDHLLAETIRRLAALPDRDSALLYMSDHGESLGEHGIYLHGLPYAIAPHEQKEVPMVFWMSPGFARSMDLDAACLARRATLPISHDYLFHSMLGLLQVVTQAYDPAFDFSADCHVLRSAGNARRANKTGAAG